MSTNFTKFYNGLNVVPQSTEAVSAAGDVRFNSATNKLEVYTTTADSVVTETGTATLTNKTINASNNTITNLTASNFASGSAPANQTLSNLTSPTAVNQSLLPSVTDSVSLGNSSLEWLNIYGQNVLSINLSQMVVGTADAQSGFKFQGSSTKLNTSYAPIAMGAQKITGLADPTAAQDAVTLNYLSTNYSNITLGTANGLTLVSHVLSLGTASTSTTGALTSTDWNTFNGKQASGNYITALTGDITASGPGSVAATLATVNSTVGSFTNASITVNAKGLITAASSGVALTIGTIDSQTASSNGLVIASNTLYAQSASATNPGLVNTTTQTLAGTKTFSSPIQLTPNASSPTLSKGLMWYDNNNDTLAYYNAIGEVQVGKQIVFSAYNQTGSTISAGSVVYVNGTYIGQYPTIALAQSNSLTTSVVIGVTSGAISNNTQGYVVVSGLVTGVNTSAYTAGTDLFLSPTTPGALTNTVPSNPNYSIQVGVAISSSTSGSILVVPEYLSVPATNVVGTLGISQGGTGQTTASAAFNALSPITSTGDLIIGNGTNSATRLAIGTSGAVLTSNGTTASWATVTGANSVKNYLGNINGVNNNGNFETGTVGSWQTSFTALTAGVTPNGAPTVPDTGVAGAVSVISSSPLAGSYSMNFSSTVATGYNLPAGHGFSSPIFTIDQEDQAKVLSFRFAYQYVSGGAVNFSGTSSNTMVIWIWDITNSTWIQPAGVYSMNQSSGVGIASGTFQTASNGSQYRLVVFSFNPPTTGTLFSMNFDDFSVGPQVSPLAPAMSDLVVYTPTVTGFGTATTFNVTSSRVADKLYVQGSFVSGTSTAVQAQMTLGYLGVSGNVTSDNSGKIGATRTVGKWSSGATGAGGSILATANQNYVTFGLDSGSGTTSANASSIVSSGQTITFEFMLPINGWSSNSVASSDTDTRTVDFYGVNTANTSFTGTTITVPFTAQVDTHAGFNGGGIYTIPVAGWYTITSDNPIYATPTTGNAVLNILVNGTSKRQSYVAFTSVGQAAPISAVLSYYAKAGDQISVTLTNSTGGMALLGTVVGTQAVLSIQRISGPAVISATESVNGLYTDQSAATIGTSPATYTFAAKVRDSHNAYASGTLTIPVSGMYTFTAQMTTAAVSLATNQSFGVAVYRNGTQISEGLQSGSGAANNYSAITSVSYPCLAGDLITVRPAASVATTGYSGAGYNNFSWARVGN